MPGGNPVAGRSAVPVRSPDSTGTALTGVLDAAIGDSCRVFAPARLSTRYPQAGGWPGDLLGISNNRSTSAKTRVYAECPRRFPLALTRQAPCQPTRLLRRARESDECADGGRAT